MTKKQIEAHLGYSESELACSHPDAKLRAKSGIVIGGLRHSSAKYSGSTKVGFVLASDERGEYWHYHETNGRSHCTRRIYADEIAGPA